MKILINCSNLKIGGGLQVANSFINSLNNFSENDYVIVISNEVSKDVDINKFGSNFEFHIYNIKLGFNLVTGNNSFLDSLVIKNKIDSVFTLFGPSYWKPKVMHLCGYARPHYVYKNSPFFKLLTTTEKFNLLLKEYIHLRDFRLNNQAIVTENPDVSERLKKIIKKKSIFTVSNTYHQVFDNTELWDKSIILPKFKGHYILTISANYKHKNLKILFDTIRLLVKSGFKNFKFVLTINENDFQLEDSIKQQIIFLGKISIYKCPFLYSQVSLVILPTLLECFSATYLEAMKMKKVLLTSDLGFARGICQDTAIYFNPLDANDIKNKILIALNSPSFCQDLVEKGYNRLSKFENSYSRAEKYISIIRNLQS